MINELWFDADNHSVARVFETRAFSTPRSVVNRIGDRVVFYSRIKSLSALRCNLLPVIP